jgi:hypothetical protein
LSPSPGPFMTAPKTRPTRASVTAYIAKARDPEQRRDARSLLGLMREATGAKPVMWGDSIVGFGRHEYPGARGRTASWPVLGFAIRGTSLTLYVMTGFGAHKALLKDLGTFKTGKGCLYIRRLGDVELPVLRQLIRDTAAAIQG